MEVFSIISVLEIFLFLSLQGIVYSKQTWINFDKNKENIQDGFVMIGFSKTNKLNLSLYNGIDFCAGDTQSKCFTSLNDDIKKAYDNKLTFRISCEKDNSESDSLNIMVCWYRQKVYNPITVGKRTELEIQFWQDEQNKAQARWSSPDAK